MMRPFFDSNWPLQLRRGKINIYQLLQNTSARNNSIKMEVILFASLYRAKEILIFCVHFFRRTFYPRGATEVEFFLLYKKASGGENLEVLGSFFFFSLQLLVAFGRPFYLWTVLPGVPRHWRVPPASGGHPPRLLLPSGRLGLLPGA